MRFVRYQYKGKTAYGELKDKTIHELAGNLFGKVKKTGKRVPLAKAKLLAPCTPGKILAIGRNYKTHIGDRTAPTKPEAFIKTATSVQDPEGDVIIPKISGGNIHYEGELVVVIGKRGKHIAATDALDYVFGYTIGNDISERDWQSGPEKDLQWARAKSSDTFTPVGPIIATDLDPAKCMLQTRVNGQVKQEQTTGDLVFDIPTIIEQVSQTMTLEPGDLIFTGTPGRTEKMNPGDTVEVEITGLGILRNHIKAEA